MNIDERRQQLEVILEQHRRALVQRAHDDLLIGDTMNVNLANCWWLRAAAVVQHLGIPAITLLWFMGMWSGLINSPMTAIAAEVRTLTVELQSHRSSNERVLAELAAVLARQQNLLQVLCTAVVDKSMTRECLR